MFKKLCKHLLPSLLALTLTVTAGTGMGIALAKYAHHAEVATLNLTIGSDIVTLVDGGTFATAIEGATKVTFGLFKENTYGFDWDEPGYVNVSTDTANAPIRLFKSGTEYYVLSDIKIVANEDCKGMFAPKGNKSGVSTILGFEEGVVDTSAVANMANMFAGTNIQNINDILLAMDTTSVTDMSGMFADSGYQELDLSSFKTEKVTNMSKMFNNCVNLITIYVSADGWNTESVTNGGNMFQKTTKLVGGNGTSYNKNYLNVDYARIDKEGVPGYLTEKTNANAILYVPRPNVMPEGSATLTPPEQEVIQTLTVNTSNLHGAYVAEVAAGRTAWNVGENVVLTLRISDSGNQLPNYIYVNVGGAEYAIPTTQNMLGTNINSVGGITYNTETYQLTIPASMATGDIAISAFG